MDQHALRELEQRCIQEEPPPCTAGCPLHVDVRAFVDQVKSGRWTQALKILHRSMPLVGILGRICDAPCQQVCNRQEAGEAIRIADLERACVQRVGEARRVMPLPKKNMQVAVVGSGLSGLTVAWDLVRKGYLVTVFDPSPWLGDGLLKTYPSSLSQVIIAEELNLLAHLGVEFQGKMKLTAEAACQEIRDGHGAVYVGLDALSGDPWGVDLKLVGEQEATPGLTSRDGLFAGGDHPSPVWRAAQGRWAATSMDRWLQKVSMSAGREKEGPFENRLFTNLKGVDSLPAVAMADPWIGYSEAEALQEAGRCLQCQCLECVKVCAYLEQFGGYPKRYAREIYNNASIVMGERKANRLINSCSLCGLCEIVCPHDFAMQDLCLEARQSMIARGKMPPSAHDFALEDLAFSQSEHFAMFRHAPGFTSSRFLFFPGCQLCASAPRQVSQVYKFLREKLPLGVGLMLGCCGAPAHWTGQQEKFSTLLTTWQTAWREQGRPQPIMACATCLRMFKDHLPEAGVVSLWEILETTGLPQSDLYRPRSALAIHDPCTSRGKPAVQEAVRRILSHLGVSAEELDLGREQTECCGFGGLMENANPDLAREVARRRGRRSPNDYLTYCAMCRDSLAGVGKRALHLLDLLFADSRENDPAERPRPGWSRRRENRMGLKANLLRDVWGEGPGAAEDESGVPELFIAPEVEALLESRRILEEDIREVIEHAETGGARFQHSESGHFLALFRPFQATFWVDYSPEGEGFRIHSAYAHRMEVLGP